MPQCWHYWWCWNNIWIYGIGSGISITVLAMASGLWYQHYCTSNSIGFTMYTLWYMEHCCCYVPLPEFLLQLQHTHYGTGNIIALTVLEISLALKCLQWNQHFSLRKGGSIMVLTMSLLYEHLMVLVLCCWQQIWLSHKEYLSMSAVNLHMNNLDNY